MKINLPDFIKTNLTAQTISNKRFFFCRDKYRVRKYTFRDIYDYSLKFACLLREIGIGLGDKVILKGANSPEWVIAFIGILLRGAVAVPLDLKSSPAFDKKVFNKVRAKCIVSDSSCAFNDFNRSAAKGYGKFKKIILEDIRGTLSGADYMDDAVLPNRDSGSIAEIVFTSGTTSEPRGVKISFRNIEANLESIIPVMKKYGSFFGAMVNPKILSLVPLSHLYGQLLGIFTPLMIKSSIMFTNSISPQHILRVIKEEKIWMLGILPRLLEMLKDHIVEKFNLSGDKFLRLYQNMKTKKWQLRFFAFMNIHFRIGWRLVAFMVGGAVLEPAVDEFFRCLAYAIFQGYGLTETAPLVTLSDPIGGVAGSVGKVLGGQEVKIVDGEVFVRGENVSSGYYGDELHSKEVFKKGWFKTGDIAEVDKNGNFFFRGRKDDVIVRSDGLNIYPADIESAVRSTGSVKDCAVIGAKVSGSDRIYAFIILRDRAALSGEEIIAQSNKKLNVYQKIDGYFIYDKEDFPRTPTMKVQKSYLAGILKQNFGQLKTGNDLVSGKDITSGAGYPDSAHPENARIEKLYNIIKSIGKTGKRRLKKSDRLEDDAGLDSIGMIELAQAIEDNYNIAVDDSCIGRDTTVSDIEKIISGPKTEIKKIPFYSFPYWSFTRVFRAAFQLLIFLFLPVLYILRVRGKENLKNIKGPLVFAANHTSNLDTFVILQSLPVKIRFKVIALMSIEHHFRNFFYRKGSWIRRIMEAYGFYLLVNLAIGALPLSRTHGFKQVLENTGRLMDRGYHILIFPEGGVSVDGSIKRFESGVGIIASDMSAPVVPVKIEGLYNILRNGILPWGHMPRRPIIKVTFGKPVIFKDRTYKEISNELEEIIKKRL